MTSTRSGINQRIADRLLTQGLLDRDQHLRAVDYATRRKTRIEEALIELEFLTEPELLKFIATVHGTRFVSSEKLSKAVIDARLLARVPLKLAELHGVFPVLYDDKAGALSVVTADPDNDLAIQEVKLSAAVREVRALAARPAAVRAAISLHYRNDRAAFAALLRPIGLGELFNEDPFERKSTSGRATPDHVSRSITGLVDLPPSPPPPLPPVERVPAVLPLPARMPAVTAPTPVVHATPPTVAVSPPTIPVSRTPSLPPPEPSLLPTATPEFIEMLNVLGSLLESTRQDLRGHSATVARITRKTCERIGLNPLQIAAFTSAAYLHDLGKMGAYHLTALNVAEYEGHRVAATKSVDLPLHLTESVGLIAETKLAISSMYERYDGEGFPNGYSGKEIPLGARILSVADTYADLTQNPRNPYRKILRPFEACEVLVKYRATIFDPNIVDLFKQAMTGEDMRAKLLSDRHEALIIDPDPEETTVLELRLIEHGFEVKIARNSSQARKLLEAGEVAVVVSEIDLEKPEAGLVLREASLKEGFGREVTWVMLTSKTDRGTAQRAFDLGVDDFVLKPVSTDIFAAKLRQMIERRAANSGGRGVSGSLAEMSLPDMVQILWHGRKTCALRITAQSSSGEIDFAEGQVVDARWDALRGEAAFYKMISLSAGDFRLDPTYKPTSRSIQASPEALLLEGMRRLDEASA